MSIQDTIEKKSSVKSESHATYGDLFLGSEIGLNIKSQVWEDS